jgi:hypothetical protein
MMAGGREGPRRGREQAQLRITTFPWCPDRLLGQHIAAGATLSVEVTERRIDDRGGGLARVNGMVRLVEGLALPREEDEAKLGHDDTPTSWITIDPLLELFGLTRASLADEARVKAGVRAPPGAAARARPAIEGRRPARRLGPRRLLGLHRGPGGFRRRGSPAGAQGQHRRGP